MTRTRTGVLALLIGLTVVVPAQTASAKAKTRRISVNSQGQQVAGDAYLWKRSISKSGRYVVFETNQMLVPTDDAVTISDVYLRDRKTGKTKIISVAEGSKVGGNAAFAPAISADGRLVVFEASGDSLVPGDTNGTTDVFVRDRKTGKVRRVNVSSSGAQADDGGVQPSISPNGRYVAFSSVSGDLVLGDNNGLSDIFVRDRKEKKTRRVSVASNGAEANGSSDRPSVADNGTVAFASGADNLVPGDSNNTYDVFVHKLKKKKTKRVSVASNGAQGDNLSDSAAISRDGNVVSFQSASIFKPVASGVYREIWVHVVSSGKTSLITKGVGGTPSDNGSTAYQGALSYNGRYVAFSSFAGNLVPGDDNGVADMFWYDRKSKKMKLVSRTFDGSDLDAGAPEGSISGDGRFVAFDSNATNVLPDELSSDSTVFFRGALHNN